MTATTGASRPARRADAATTIAWAAAQAGVDLAFEEGRMGVDQILAARRE
jgi:hypothetical protein